jgi:hypothetical protein
MSSTYFGVISLRFRECRIPLILIPTGDRRRLIPNFECTKFDLLKEEIKESWCFRHLFSQAWLQNEVKPRYFGTRNGKPFRPFLSGISQIGWWQSSAALLQDLMRKLVKGIVCYIKPPVTTPHVAFFKNFFLSVPFPFYQFNFTTSIKNIKLQIPVWNSKSPSEQKA